MIKKCMGCGLILQDKDEFSPGYTPDLKKDYCRRCFRLKNYGERKEKDFKENTHNFWSSDCDNCYNMYSFTDNK